MKKTLIIFVIGVILLAIIDIFLGIKFENVSFTAIVIHKLLYVFLGMSMGKYFDKAWKI